MLRGFTQDKLGNDVFFGTEKFFEKTLPALGKHLRPGQLEMALDIIDTLGSKKQIRIVEAGVGIGKSYAYLVPALLAKKANPRLSIIISTGTISLQEQLVEDFKVLANQLGMYVPIVLAKGQTHFLCKERARSFFVKRKVPKWLDRVDMISEFGDRSVIEASIGESISNWDSLHVHELCSCSQ